MAGLPREFSYEPTTGLEAGADGMAMVRSILKQAKEYLSDDGILVVEVGYSRPTLEQLLPDVPFTWLEFEHGGYGVFLLGAAQLREYQAIFDAL
jgi:ribosomal protein L3 glutamine methyltransferase